MKTSSVAWGWLLVFFAAREGGALAGARIDLRPDPPVPPGGYEPNTLVTIDVFIVDTGNPQQDISFRLISLDFNDSPPWTPEAGTLSYPDPDGPGPLGPNQFSWINPFSTCITGECGQSLPRPFWVYPSPAPVPILQITMPDNGEVRVGGMTVDVGMSGGVLNALNADEPDANFGARADFGFGGPGDPVTIWRAYTGELTGGVLELPVVPEPGTCLLLAATVAALRIRRVRR